jgi:hypothetical protein
MNVASVRISRKHSLLGDREVGKRKMVLSKTIKLEERSAIDPVRFSLIIKQPRYRDTTKSKCWTSPDQEHPYVVHSYSSGDTGQYPLCTLRTSRDCGIGRRCYVTTSTSGDDLVTHSNVTLDFRLDTIIQLQVRKGSGDEAASTWPLSTQQGQNINLECWDSRGQLCSTQCSLRWSRKREQ